MICTSPSSDWITAGTSHDADAFVPVRVNLGHPASLSFVTVPRYGCPTYSTILPTACPVWLSRWVIRRVCDLNLNKSYPREYVQSGGISILPHCIVKQLNRCRAKSLRRQSCSRNSGELTMWRDFIPWKHQSLLRGFALKPSFTLETAIQSSMKGICRLRSHSPGKLPA